MNESFIRNLFKIWLTFLSRLRSSAMISSSNFWVFSFWVTKFRLMIIFSVLRQKVGDDFGRFFSYKLVYNYNTGWQRNGIDSQQKRKMLCLSNSIMKKVILDNFSVFYFLRDHNLPGVSSKNCPMLCFLQNTEPSQFFIRGCSGKTKLSICLGVWKVLLRLLLSAFFDWVRPRCVWANWVNWAAKPKKE